MAYSISLTITNEETGHNKNVILNEFLAIAYREVISGTLHDRHQNKINVNAWGATM